MKRLLPLCLLLVVGPLFAGGDDPKDPSTWTPARIKGKQKAPEFANIDDWINSDPLTMAQLKGKVVVIHFMAFG